MGDNAGQIGTKVVSKNYPVISSTGVDEDDYHKDRIINLVPEESSKVSAKVKETL
jgi:hypothetical protein